MAHYLQDDVVVVCSCGSLRPLTKLYFCRHCVVLRCGYCIGHEVDTIYCSNCLENLPSSEAKLRKNRCNTCFSCPCCFHILTIRASTISRTNPPAKVASPASTKTPTKSYYLSCFFCRWTTRDAKIPDQLQLTSSNWPEHENQHSARIASLVEYYKMMSYREKLEKENRLFLHSSRRSFKHFSEGFGLTAMIARKRAGLPPLHLGRDEHTTAPKVEPAEASEDVDSLPEDVFTKAVDFVCVTSLPQRFLIPDLQSESTHDLFPLHKQLSVKRSLRCKSCLHNILKPEYGPASIKFKILSAAYFNVPEIRLVKKVSCKRGESADIVLKIINPSQSGTNVEFLQLADVVEAVPIPPVKVEKKEVELADMKSMGSLVTIEKKEYPLEKPRSVQVDCNCKVELTDARITLPAREDTAEYDDVNDTNQGQDNPAFVIWQKGNQVQVKFSVTADEKVESGDELKVGFGMRFTYHDRIVSPLETKKSIDVNLDVKHYLSIGFVE